MAIKKENVLFWFSLASLTLFITIYPELFLFSKRVSLPKWTGYFIQPLDTGRYIAFILLLPVGLFSFQGVKRIKLILKVILLSPIPAIIIRHNIDIFNMVFQYIWVILWNLSIPTIAVIFLGVLMDLYKKKLYAK